MNYGGAIGASDADYHFDLEGYSPPSRQSQPRARSSRVSKASVLAQARSKAHKQPALRAAAEESDSFSSSLDLTDSIVSPDAGYSSGFGGLGSKAVYEASALSDGDSIGHDSAAGSGGAQSLPLTSPLVPASYARAGSAAGSLGGSSMSGDDDLQFEDSQEVSPLPRATKHEEEAELEFEDSQVVDDAPSVDEESLEIVDSPEVARGTVQSIPKPSSASAALRIGTRVTAQWGGSSGDGQWFPGTVRAIHADGSYSIAYDDGDFEEQVPPRLVRAQDPSPVQAPAPAPTPAVAVRSFASKPSTAGQALQSAGVSPVPSVPDSVPSSNGEGSEYDDEQFEGTEVLGSSLVRQYPLQSQAQPQQAPDDKSLSSDSYSEFGSASRVVSEAQPASTGGADVAAEASDTGYTLSFEDVQPSARSMEQPAQSNRLSPAPTKANKAVAWQQLHMHAQPSHGTHSENAPSSGTMRPPSHTSQQVHSSQQQSATSNRPSNAPTPPQHQQQHQAYGHHTAAQPPPPQHQPYGHHTAAQPPPMPYATSGGYPYTQMPSAPPHQAWPASGLFQPVQVPHFAQSGPLASAVYLQHLSAALLGPVSSPGTQGALQGINDSMARYRSSLRRSEEVFSKQLSMLRQQLAAVNSIRRTRSAAVGSTRHLQLDGSSQTNSNPSLTDAANRPATDAHEQRVPQTVAATEASIRAPSAAAASTSAVLPMPSDVDHSLPPSMQRSRQRSAFAVLHPQQLSADAAAKDYAARGRLPAMASQ